MADAGYRWRDGHPQRKKAWAARLAAGPVVCGSPDCDRLVYADAALNYDGRTWHLGHGRALKHGGDGSDSTPWHATCNLRDAAALTNHPVRVSRDWWA